MGGRRTRAGAVMAIAVVLGLVGLGAAMGPVSAGDGPRLTRQAAGVSVPSPTLAAVPVPQASTANPVCQASQLHVTPLGFKVALGTVVGTYGVETDGCSLALDRPDVLTTIDGGVPPIDAVLRRPGEVDITYRNPNIQTAAPVPPLPVIPSPPRAPPLTVPPITLPSNPALQPVTAAVDAVRNQVNGA